MTGPADPLIPTLSERLSRARGDLRMGVPVVVTGGARMALVAAVEGLGETRLAALHALGEVDLAITARRADTLKARAYDGDLARIKVPADAGLRWIAAVADPVDDLAMPMKGPFHTRRDGPADLHRAGLALAKAALLLPAVVVVPLISADGLDGLTHVVADDCGALTDPPFRDVVSARLPMAVSEAGRIHVFRPDDGGTEHYAIEIGRPDRDRPVMVRLHSACFTGDVLGSLKCDCGPQLQAALARMGAEGAGLLLYLNQEGRGIGLANKLRAYALQDQGFDTVEANHRLGFEDDERDFRVGATLLRSLGFTAVRLLTNNPAKVAMLSANGIDVTERVPLLAGRTARNEGYLATKAARSGHLL